MAREIKQEVLSDMTDVHALTEKRVKRRARRGACDVKSMVKQESEEKRRMRRAKKEPKLQHAQAISDNLEMLARAAPRRPYQWKGRRVRRIVKPGVVVTFTPGQRSKRRMRREYDEVYADADALEQAAAREGEYAYGKRRAIITSSNPTPSQVPVTPQTTIAPSETAKAKDPLLPTVQVLVPRKRKAQEQSSHVQVKMRASENIMPGLKVETMDVSIPVNSKESEQALVASLADTLENQAMAVSEPMENSVPLTARKTCRRSPRVPTVSTAAANVIKTVIPKAQILACEKKKRRSWADATTFVRYHPSINSHGKKSSKLGHLLSTQERYTKDGQLIPAVVYHPSIMKRY